MTRRSLTAGAFLILGGLLLTFVVVGVFMGSFPDSSTDCADDTGGQGDTVIDDVAAHPVGNLSAAQLSNAGQVIAEGRRRHLPSRAVLIALAAASQESHFTNYANDGRGGDLYAFQRGVSASLSLPHEAVGTDHGSLGIFQQQWPWWGSMRELMTPHVAASKFYNALAKVPGWEHMSVTDAAQSVQHSAYPDAYADDETLARDLLGGTAGATSIDNAAFTAVGSGCTDTVTTDGDVRFPLPTNARYVDRHNWGHSGGHWASWHTGTDLSVACGTPVLAATAGTVIVRTDQPWAGHWLVEVSTGTGQLTTWYAHMRRLIVTDGQTVSAGEQIGEVGDLGNATGCHLHFEVHPRGGSIYQDSVNPSRWLEEHVGRHDQLGVIPASSTSSGSSFIVATFNVLGASHTRAGGEEPWMASGRARIRGVIRLLDGYRVDVVGFQEFQGPQRNTFVARAGSTYAVWHAHGDSENAIAWRRSRFAFVGATTVRIPYFNGQTRRMPVVKLQDRYTGRTTVFFNVHNPADTGQYHHQGGWRARAIAREIRLVRSLSNVGEAVVMTGDLNATRSAYCPLTRQASLRAAAGDPGGTACRVPDRHHRIDWILGNRRTAFDDYTVNRSTLVRRTTDHPIVLTRAVVG